MNIWIYCSDTEETSAKENNREGHSSEASMYCLTQNASVTICNQKPIDLRVIWKVIV